MAQTRVDEVATSRGDNPGWVNLQQKTAPPGIVARFPLPAEFPPSREGICIPGRFSGNSPDNLARERLGAPLFGIFIHPGIYHRGKIPRGRAVGAKRYGPNPTGQDPGPLPKLLNPSHSLGTFNIVTRFIW